MSSHTKLKDVDFALMRCCHSKANSGMSQEKTAFVKQYKIVPASWVLGDNSEVGCSMAG